MCVRGPDDIDIRMSSEAERAAKRVVIVGAGLAGLTCAKALAAAGREFVLCEAADEAGGRVASRRTSEGYILDRGFQVLLDSYPAARRHLDLRALGGGRFRAGALFVGQGPPRALENPLRRPAALVEGLRGDVIPVADGVRLAVLGAAAVAGYRPRPDVSTRALLAAWGFGARFLRDFARPFFGGVLLDPELGTSAALFLEYLRRFATGRALLPGAGMAAIPRQLSSSLPSGSLRLNARVGALVLGGDGVEGVRVNGGEFLAASDVVLAVDEPAACRLLERGSPRPALSTAVHYFAAARPWYAGPWLCLPPRRRECPVLHATLVTNAAPTLAPEGRHLWSVTVLPDHPRAADAEFVAAVVAGWFGAKAGELSSVDFVRVPYAVPAQAPGFAARPAPWGHLPRGVRVTGDAVCGASIDATMAAGEATAKNLISSG